MDSKDSVAGSGRPRIGLCDDNGSVTEIEHVNMLRESAEAYDVYNLSGQAVRVNASSAERLAKGIYIVNGKKIVIK